MWLRETTVNRYHPAFKPLRRLGQAILRIHATPEAALAIPRPLDNIAFYH
jgi:hypothetical protein